MGLGLLYSAGAIVKSGQLRSAHVSVRDTLPLVPLEQILALGIGIIVTSIVTVFVFALVLWVYVGWWTPEPPAIRVSAPLFPLVRALRCLLAVAFIVWIFFTIPPLGALSVTAALFLGGGVRRIYGRGRRYVAYVVLGYLAFILVLNAANGYIYPKPLPEVELRLKNQATPVVGTMLLTTGTTWYFTQHAQTFRAISAEKVAVAIVRSRSRRHEPRPMLRVLWDEIRERS